MPGLSFLAKKSWHTSNLDNVERVWLAEQKADQEKKKVAELQKQIHEERQIQELRQLQIQSGKVIKSVDTTLDWMYEGAGTRSHQSAEEYLLGKVYKPPADEQSDIHKLSKDPGSLWLNKISAKNDTFTRLHEDPLLMIKKSEKKSREDIVNNPVKMARIQHQLQAEIDAKKAKKEKKEKSKKEKKEKKSKEKHRRDKEDPSGSDSESSRSSRSQRRRRYDSRERDDRRHRRSCSRSRSRSRDRSRTYGDKDHVEHKRSRNDFDSHRSEVRNSDRGRDEPRSTSDYSRKSVAGYGLVKSGTQPLVPTAGKVELGPSAALLEKKLEKERQANAWKSRPRQDVGKLSEDERLKRIKEMQQDAGLNDSIRQSRSSVASAVAAAGAKDEEYESAHQPSATFLKNMRHEVYNGSSGSIEDRLKQNRHYVQRGNDMESQGFLKR